MNTKGTASRSDDVMTTYSSRGPTKFEHAVKPDVVAPGNKIVSLETSGSYLQRNYPQFHMAGKWGNSYMHLSGTSMSAAIVTAGVAMLMQGSPNITSTQLKIALQSGSTLHVGRRVDGRRCRQRQLLDEPEGGRIGSDEPRGNSRRRCPVACRRRCVLGLRQHDEAGLRRHRPPVAVAAGRHRWHGSRADT